MLSNIPLGDLLPPTELVSLRQLMQRYGVGSDPKDDGFTKIKDALQELVTASNGKRITKKDLAARSGYSQQGITKILNRNEIRSFKEFLRQYGG